MNCIKCISKRNKSLLGPLFHLITCKREAVLRGQQNIVLYTFYITLENGSTRL